MTETDLLAVKIQQATSLIISLESDSCSEHLEVAKVAKDFLILQFTAGAK